MFSGANEEKLSNVFPRNPLPSPTTPSKALKTDAFSTPSKQSNGNPADSSIVKLKTSPPTGTIEGLQQRLLTPGLLSNDNLLFLDETHTLRRFRDITDQESELAIQPLQIFEREKISIKHQSEGRSPRNRKHARYADVRSFLISQWGPRWIKDPASN